MARRKKDMLGAIQPAAEVAAGIIAAKVLKTQAFDKVDFIASNPIIGAGAKIALGVVGASKMRSKTVKNLAAGVVVDGILDLYDHFQSPASSVGRFPSLRGGSRNIPGDMGFQARHHIAAQPRMADRVVLQ